MHREAGFSFVELLVTIIIAGIAFAAMVPVFVQAHAGERCGQGTQRSALNVAQDKRREDSAARLRPHHVGQPQSARPTRRTGCTPRSLDRVDDRRTRPTTSPTRSRSSPMTASKKLYKRVTVAVTWGDPATQPSVDGTDGVTLRTFIYKQYAGPQIVDLYLASPVGSAVDMTTAPYVINWDESTMGPLTVRSRCGTQSGGRQHEREVGHIHGLWGGERSGAQRGRRHAQRFAGSLRRELAACHGRVCRRHLPVRSDCLLSCGGLCGEHIRRGVAGSSPALPRSRPAFTSVRA